MSSVVLQLQKNLDLWVDRSLTLEHHIHQVCKSANKQIFMIYKICPLITQDSAQTLVHALVTLKLDYGNALYFGISKSLLHKLQLVQNAAAHLVCGVYRYSEHYTGFQSNTVLNIRSSALFQGNIWTCTRLYL